MSLVGDVRRTLAVRRLSRRVVTRAERLCASRVQNRAGMRIRTSGESEWRLGLYDDVGELVEYVERGAIHAGTGTGVTERPGLAASEVVAPRSERGRDLSAVLEDVD